MAKPKILFTGFAVADFIAGKTYLGGAAGSMSINASKLGIDSSLLAPLSNDNFGKLYKDELVKSMVHHDLCDFSSPHLPTCIITDQLGIGSTRNWQDNGALEYLLKMSIPNRLNNQFDFIFLCNVWKDIGEKITQKTNVRCLFYIPGPKAVNNPSWISPNILDKTLIVFCNEEESPSIWANDPFSHGVQIVVSTAGENGGSVYLFDGQIISYHASRVKKMVDPTGAGDSWSLGFTVEWIKTRDIISAIDLGNKLSSECIQTKGAILPYENFRKSNRT